MYIISTTYLDTQQYLLLLRYLESGPRTFRHWLMTWISQSIGLTFAMAVSNVSQSVSQSLVSHSHVVAHLVS